MVLINLVKFLSNLSVEDLIHSLKSVIKEKYGGDATLIGDEGGFAPPIDVQQGVDLLMELGVKKTIFILFLSFFAMWALLHVSSVLIARIVSWVCAEESEEE